jgi:hypothetical protein
MSVENPMKDLLIYYTNYIAIVRLEVFTAVVSSTLKMEAIRSSETSVATQQTTRRHIPEDDTVHIVIAPPPRRYLYCDVVVGLAWSYVPGSYAGGSVAAGRISHAGQVKGDDPDKKGYPPGWRWG